jgi:hypothetical protein
MCHAFLVQLNTLELAIQLLALLDHNPFLFGKAFYVTVRFRNFLVGVQQGCWFHVLGSSLPVEETEYGRTPACLPMEIEAQITASMSAEPKHIQFPGFSIIIFQNTHNRTKGNRTPIYHRFLGLLEA